MGKFKIVQKLLSFLQSNDEKAAKQVSKRTDKVDSDQVEKGIDKANEAAEKKR